MSRFTVDKALVVRAAENAIADIKAYRKRLFDKEVDKATRRIWPFRNRTREEAEAHVRDWGGPCEGWKIGSWGTMGQAECLLEACAVTVVDSVQLSGNDAAFVNKWKDKTPREELT